MEAFRNQFYFGNSNLAAPRNFMETEFGPDRRLLAHRDLPVASIVEPSTYTILLGFCFDFEAAERSLEQICEAIHSTAREALIDATDSLAGRWVLIRQDTQGIIAFSDAGATLPICHISCDNGASIATSARLIEWMHPDRPANELITKDFRKLQATPGRHAGFNFPLVATSMADVFALLPNHALDLSSGVPERIFPGSSTYGTEPSEKMVPTIANTLRSIMSTASLHYEFEFAATGGFDSLVLQSAISSVDGLAKRTNFFTFRYPTDPEASHPDIQNARRSTRFIKAPHQIISAKSDEAIEKVQQICRESEEFYASGFEGWVEAYSEYSNPQKLVIMGWASEIARGFYRWAGSRHVETEELMRCTGLSEMHQFRPMFETWKQDAFEAEAASGIAVLDLFYWENRVGRWCGPGLNILNTDANWITLFSCRGLLKQMLAVRERDRVGRRQKLYRALIVELEPRLAEVTPNPMTLPERVSYALRTELKDHMLSLAIRFKLDGIFRRSRR